MLLLVAAAVLAAPVTAAADESDAPGHPWRRRLNGHYFVPSLVVVNPFLATWFSSQLGFGVAFADGPSFNPTGNRSGSDSYVAGALAETVAFQANVLDWWALRIAGGGGLYGGQDAKSALVLGATEFFSVTPGTTVAWTIGRTLKLGGALDFTWSPSRVVDPLAAVQRSLAQASATSSGVSERVSSFEIRTGGTVAWAPHAAFGLLGAALYLWQDKTGDAGEQLHAMVLGVSAQFDFLPIFPSAPVALLASYQARIPLGSDVRTTQDIEAGIYYTARPALVLGAVSQVRFFDVRPGFSTTALFGTALLRYYWN